MTRMADGSPRAKDYVELAGLGRFAVIDDRREDGRILSVLRYVPSGAGWRKLATAAAFQHVAAYWPELDFHSRLLDARVHGIPLEAVDRVHSARAGALRLWHGTAAGKAAIARRALRLLSGAGVPLERLGVTGSVLLGCEGPASDVDCVVFGEAAFERARAAVAALQAGCGSFALTEQQWREAWARRGCALALEVYRWHEQRKANKLVLEGTKVDITCLPEQPAAGLPVSPARKLRPARLCARVVDASEAFATPARYRLAGGPVAELLAATATYAGQARTGEWVEAAGWLEETAEGRRRLVVGTSREAAGEFIRVVSGPSPDP